MGLIAVSHNLRCLLIVKALSELFKPLQPSEGRGGFPFSLSGEPASNPPRGRYPTHRRGNPEPNPHPKKPQTEA